MSIIDEKFKENVENINFLELMPGSKLEIGDFILDEDIPLPVLQNSLLEGIKKSKNSKVENIEDSINIEYVVEGIIDLIGSDKSFKYNEDYTKLLKSYNSNIEDYILYLAMNDLEKDKIYHAGIKFRTILEINKSNLKANFNYGLILEMIGLKISDEGEDKIGQVYIDESTRFFEKTLDIDENFSYSYYKLGYHYKNSGQFLKASLIWEKFLEKNEDEELKQSIRDEISIIEDDTNMETGITYLLYNDYDKALIYFSKLLPKYEKMWNLNMLLGRTYAGLEKFEESIGYYRESIELKPDELDPYNELAIVYINMGLIDQAIDTLTQAIDKEICDYKIYFNRALAYLQINKIDMARKDLNKALELNPEDLNLRKQIDEIEKQI